MCKRTMKIGEQIEVWTHHLRQTAEVFALRFTVGRDQSYKGGRKAVVRLRGQRSDWEGKGLGMGDRQQCFWDEKTLTAGSGNNICGCGTDRGPSASRAES